MDVAELTQAAMLAFQPASLEESESYDHQEAYMLLGRILGVLIRKSRLAAERIAGRLRGLHAVGAGGY